MSVTDVANEGTRETNTTGPSRQRHRANVIMGQLGLLAAILTAWQYLPQISLLQQQSHLFDSYFVSSPSRVATRVYELATGANGVVYIWSYILPTISASLAGTAIGTLAGCICGLILSNFRYASAVVRPFIVAANATPRVALVPVVVIIFGPTFTSSVVLAVLVVFFVAFFSAYEGGTSIPPALINNVKLLGGSRLAVMGIVRLRYVGAWTLASLPLGITFAVMSVVTGELLTGYHGVGALITTAETTGDSALTFSVVFYLAVVGVIIVAGAEMIKERVLHWWGK